MVIVLIPVLAAVLGILVYVLAVNPKAAELGRMLAFAGMLAGLLLSQHVVRLT